MLKLIVAPALICVASLGLAEYYAYQYTEPHISKSIKSYHVTIDDIFVWPMASYGAYCKDYKEARKQFDKCVKDSPQTNYKIVSYPAAVTGFLFPRVIGICNDEEGQILDENKC